MNPQKIDKSFIAPASLITVIVIALVLFWCSFSVSAFNCITL